ncbi:MAG: arylesterase [Hyphomicrobiaceae bacterium]|nr:arylesterase [Hyphomicrobiaceae bacterium]
MGIAARAIKRAVVFALIALATVSASHAQASENKEGGKPLRIVALGDSLTAGFGLQPGQGFPEVLQFALKARGHEVEMVNAGVSGDTTSGGLARLDWVIDDSIDAVIVELGANDALRGQPPAQAKSNLDQIMARLAARRLPVLLAGMRAPENWGADYRQQFDTIYPELAARHGAILYPFFLDGVALDQKLNLGDGLHPNQRGIAVIVERILPAVEQLIARAEARRAAGGSAAASK